MERTSHLAVNTLIISAAILVTGIIGETAAQPIPPYQPAIAGSGREPYVILPQAGSEKLAPAQQNDEASRPLPLIRGDDDNYQRYYSLHLSPHVILRPNLQQRTQPGAVSDDPQPFVGGLEAGINF